MSDLALEVIWTNFSNPIKREVLLNQLPCATLHSSTQET